MCMLTCFSWMVAETTSSWPHVWTTCIAYTWKSVVLTKFELPNMPVFCCVHLIGRQSLTPILHWSISKFGWKTSESELIWSPALGLLSLNAKQLVVVVTRLQALCNAGTIQKTSPHADMHLLCADAQTPGIAAVLLHWHPRCQGTDFALTDIES